MNNIIKNLLILVLVSILAGVAVSAAYMLGSKEITTLEVEVNDVDLSETSRKNLQKTDELLRYVLLGVVGLMQSFPVLMPTPQDNESSVHQSHQRGIPAADSPSNGGAPLRST